MWISIDTTSLMLNMNKFQDFVSINLDIVFKIYFMPCTLVVYIKNQQLIFSFTALNLLPKSLFSCVKFFWTAFWISVFTLQFCSKNLTHTVNPYFVYKISSKLTKEVITILNNLVLAFFLLTLNNLTKAPKKLPTIPVIMGGHCFRKIRSDHNSNIYKNCYW